MFVIISAAVGKRPGVRGEQRLCRACGVSHPRFARFCRRCGRPL
jgi:predicted amidophosphoribosyltransferase